MTQGLSWKRIVWGCLVSLPLIAVFYLVTSLGFAGLLEKLFFAADLMTLFLFLLGIVFYAAAWLKGKFNPPKVL